ncbi:MAG TPA: 16S rRNA (cytosine(967)-C(5))-methyltransferase, partial [Gammaproteobacteria bacterium]|nr:16S rRNA (cytosine(967)-C(5))-methyltransferase [Gammaproteobacteria bacterium]
ITNLAGRQQALLETTWNLLAPDGVLLYATCAVLRAENEAVLSAFLAGHPEAVVEPLVTTWGHLAGAGRQNLPGEDEADGFFYARLRRVSLHR